MRNIKINFHFHLTIFLFIFHSCSSPSDENKNSGNFLSESVMNAASIDRDPSFEKDLDTVSVVGPHSISRNVLQDRNGNIWIACWEGIIKYDGVNFTNYTLKYGLRQYHVFSVMQDRNENLWFGTIGSGVYKFDGNTFANFTDADGLAGNTVMDIVEDRSGTIWFATDKGVSSFNGNDFISYTTQNGLKSNFIESMTVDLKGNVWFATNGGVNYFDNKSFYELRNSNNTSFLNVRSILADKNNTIWIGSREGLTRYNGNSISIITSSLLSDLFEDNNDNIWFSGGGANSSDLFLAKYEGKQIVNVIEKKDTLGDSELYKQVFGLAQDREGNIWLGTAKGILKYDGKDFEFFK